MMEMAETCVSIELAMEHPLFAPAIKPVIANQLVQPGGEDIDPAALFDQVVVD